jgi:hypothetical protein
VALGAYRVDSILDFRLAKIVIATFRVHRCSADYLSGNYLPRPAFRYGKRRPSLKITDKCF